MRLRPAHTLRAEPGAEQALGDLRFRKLLGSAAWNSLPIQVQRRFSKKLGAGASVIYVGKVTEMRWSRTGKLLAHGLRPLGAPLPVHCDIGAATVVSVTEDGTTGGQNWTRIFCNARRFPQVIHSAKRFSGPTGLEEYVGMGIAVYLKVEADEGGLSFVGAGYSFRLGKLRLAIPKVLAPGLLTVRHRALGPSRFEFSLSLVHPWLGELIYQAAIYEDQK